jgi:hypothetical protein
MAKNVFLQIILLGLLGLAFTNSRNYFPENSIMPPDTIKALIKQKPGTKALFKAPDGKVYTVTFETPSEGLDKDALDCATDLFHGKARKVPKTTIVKTVPTENFTVLTKFLSGLPTDTSMINNKDIKNKPDIRVSSEKRNVKLSNVFLIAVKRESDNDYHMIIGNGNNTFFNTENSGLLSTSPQKLKDVRAKMVKFMGGAFCSSMYQKFSPGIPIDIEGSLFYDVEHKPGVIGPANARPKTSWEIHPVTNIVFK